MLHHRYTKSLSGTLAGSLVLAAWGVLGIFGTATVVAGKPNPQPPPADPAIAYTLRPTRGNTSLAVCNADGSNATAIVDLGSDLALYCSWSPDGHSLVFTSGRGVYRVDISVVNGVPAASNLLQLSTRHPEGLDWSPSGDLIVMGGGYDGLIVIPATGGDETVLYNASPAFSPRWSPSGDRIAFTDAYGSRQPITINILDVATGVATPLATVDWDYYGSVGPLAWSRDGATIAFMDGARWYWAADVATGAVASLNAQSGQWSASFSADSTRLVYQSGNKSYLTTYRLSDGSVQVLSPTNVYRPEWRRNP